MFELVDWEDQNLYGEVVYMQFEEQLLQSSIPKHWRFHGASLDLVLLQARFFGRCHRPATYCHFMAGGHSRSMQWVPVHAICVDVSLHDLLVM